jgi:hypothetical protein
MRYTLLVLALLGSPVMAQQVVIHGFTHHTKPRPSGLPWNEVNPGVALRFPTEYGSWQAGVYKDSVSKPTAYILTDYTPVSYGGIKFGAFLGAKHSDKTSAIAGLVAQGKHATLRVAPAPKSKGVLFALEFSF